MIIAKKKLAPIHVDPHRYVLMKYKGGNGNNLYLVIHHCFLRRMERRDTLKQPEDDFSVLLEFGFPTIYLGVFAAEIGSVSYLSIQCSGLLPQMHSSQTSLCRPAGHSGFADALLSFSFQPVILPVMKNFCNSQEPQNSNSYWLLGVSYHTPLPVSSSANVLPSYLWFPALSLLAAVYCSHHFIELSFLRGSESFKAETVS